MFLFKAVGILPHRLLIAKHAYVTDYDFFSLIHSYLYKESSIEMLDLLIVIDLNYEMGT